MELNGGEVPIPILWTGIPREVVMKLARLTKKEYNWSTEEEDEVIVTLK